MAVAAITVFMFRLLARYNSKHMLNF